MNRLKKEISLILISRGFSPCSDGLEMFNRTVKAAAVTTLIQQTDCHDRYESINSIGLLSVERTESEKKKLSAISMMTSRLKNHKREMKRLRRDRLRQMRVPVSKYFEAKCMGRATMVSRKRPLNLYDAFTVLIDEQMRECRRIISSAKQCRIAAKDG
jgi:hypothetical protein